jgi:hypothetical protein
VLCRSTKRGNEDLADAFRTLTTRGRDRDTVTVILRCPWKDCAHPGAGIRRGAVQSI